MSVAVAIPTRSFLRWHRVLPVSVLQRRNNTGPSYYHATGKEAVSYKTVGTLLNETVEKYGDRTALVAAHQQQRITFRQAKEKVDQLASGLIELGLSKGDRVGIWAPNCVEWYVAKLALAQSGFISVYINPAYRPDEVRHCINKVGVRLLIAAESFKSQNYYQILEELAPELATTEPGKLKSKLIPSLESVVLISDRQLPGSYRYKDVISMATENSKRKFLEMSKAVQAEDACNIQFTSGTTGAPKAAVLTHLNIVNNSLFISSRQEFYLKHHTMCLLGPFFHAMGSVIGILTCLHHGTTMAIADYSFNPSKSIETITQEKCTVLLGTPTMYVDLLKIMKESKRKATTPEVAICGGALCTPSLFADMLDTFNVQRVASVYGMTESGPVSFMSKPTDKYQEMTSTVGCVMDHAEVKIVGPDGKVVPTGEKGELWVRGYFTMLGYWNDAEKTKEMITPQGWLKTGDQFTIDKDGYAKVVGRIKDLIIRGGENISPLEVEEFINTHPSVLEVQVFAVPDDRLGEQVCCCIRPKPHSELTVEQVKLFCKGKIAHYKIPHYVFFMKDFPKTASGKIQRFKIREKVLKTLQESN